jgi:hypothetical protein
MPSQIFNATQTEVLTSFLEQYQNATSKNRASIAIEAVNAIVKIEKGKGTKITDGDKQDLYEVSVLISIKVILYLINFLEN